MRRWTSVNLLAQLRRRAATQWRGWRPGTLPRLLGGIAVAWGVAAAFTVGVTLLARSLADDGLAAWDRRVMQAIADDALPLKFTDGIILESPGNLFILIPVVLLASGAAIWRGKLAVALALPLAYVAARFLIWTGWHLWDRQRPDLIADGVAALSAHSFPSGHALLSTTVYGLLAWLWMRATKRLGERAFAGVVLLLLVVAVGGARLVLGAHWPSDCIAGAAIGLLYLVGITLAIRWAEGHAVARPA